MKVKHTSGAILRSIACPLSIDDTMAPVDSPTTLMNVGLGAGWGLGLDVGVS